MGHFLARVTRTYLSRIEVINAHRSPWPPDLSPALPSRSPEQPQLTHESKSHFPEPTIPEPLPEPKSGLRYVVTVDRRFSCTIGSCTSGLRWLTFHGFNRRLRRLWGVLNSLATAPEAIYSRGLIHPQTGRASERISPVVKGCPSIHHKHLSSSAPPILAACNLVDQLRSLGNRQTFGVDAALVQQ